LSCLSSCCHDIPGLSEEHPIEVILRLEGVFFCLDHNLEKDDVQFLLQNLINVSYFRNLPSDFTGESLAKGELSKFLRRDDYAKVAAFIDSSRKSFKNLLGWVLHVFRGNLRSALASKFELSFSFPMALVTDRVYPLLPPIVSVPLNRRSSPIPHFVTNTDMCLKSISPDPGLKMAGNGEESKRSVKRMKIK
jgi:hypothetical protein